MSHRQEGHVKDGGGDWGPAATNQGAQKHSDPKEETRMDSTPEHLEEAWSCPTH